MEFFHFFSFFSFCRQNFCIQVYTHPKFDSDNQNDDFLPKSDGDTKESHPVLDTLDSGDIPF